MAIPGDLVRHDGVVTAWNLAAGANTIAVRGTEVYDLPILAQAESRAIRVGDVVALLRVKSSLFILGRVVPAPVL